MHDTMRWGFERPATIRMGVGLLWTIMGLSLVKALGAELMGALAGPRLLVRLGTMGLVGLLLREVSRGNRRAWLLLAAGSVVGIAFWLAGLPGELERSTAAGVASIAQMGVQVCALGLLAITPVSFWRV